MGCPASLRAVYGWLKPTVSKQAQALVERDPFWATALRKSIRILERTQVYANGRKMT
jgi:hypothetical protein